jgi:hypothetical protein
MDQDDPGKSEIGVAQQATDAHDGCDPELYLMSIHVPRASDKTEANSRLASRHAAQCNARVGDSTVALDPVQGIAEHIRRSEHVVEEPDLPDVEIQGEVKPEQVVSKRIRRQVEKRDLGVGLYLGLAIVHLPGRDPRPLEERSRIDASCGKAGYRKPSHDSARAGRHPIVAAHG